MTAERNLNLIKELRQDLNDVPFIKEENLADLIINVELVLFVKQLLNLNCDAEQLWTLFTGYNAPILPDTVEIQTVNKVRYLFPEFRNKYLWNGELQRYFQIQEKYRLFKLENHILTTNLPKYATFRDKNYHTILNNEIPLKANEKAFIKQGTFKYYRTIEGDTIPFRGVIPDSINLDKKRLPRYKEKLNLSFPLPLDLSQVALEMDLKNQEGNYFNRLCNLNFKSLHPSPRKLFVFSGVQHIAGGLAAGKSTWMVLEAYRQVTQNQAKIGFIEGSVSQAIARVEELRKLGLKAEPIIGKGARKKHEERFLAGKTNLENEITEKDQYLKSVSDTCLIKAVAGDFERNNFYPCKSLLQENKQKRLCPLSNSCGIYYEWTRLLEADVWVTTSAALLSSKLPPSIDIYERTIYQAMYDLLDIVFVDEADAVQKQFDDYFCNEIGAFGRQGLFFESLLEESNVLLNGRYNRFAGNPFIISWNENLKALDSSVWRLFEKLKKSSEIRKKIRSELIFPSKIVSWILGKIKTKSEEQTNKVKKELYSILNKNDNTQLTSLYNHFLQEPEEKEEYLDLAYKQLVQEEQKNEIEIKNWIEFYFYFVSIDIRLSYLLQNYTAVQNLLGMGYELSHLVNSRKEFNPILKDAMTGSFLGYRYFEDQDEIGTFKIIEYSGVGRLLLNEWSNVYKDAMLKEGPAVILLSGTSFAPGSNHYNIEMEPTWLIGTNLEQSKIIQKFLPFYDNEKNVLTVSGSPLYSRPKQLEKLLEASKNHILQELSRLALEKRRMLLVVNSYEDVSIVGSALSKVKEFQNRFVLLSNKDNYNDDGNDFYRYEIEDFKNRTEEILVVPLMAISRGYNILDEKNGALFGTCIFLIRPYPVPNDMRYIIQTLHALLPIFLTKIESLKKEFNEGINYLRHLSIGKLESMYQTPNFWSVLDEQERRSLAWYMFVPIWQMIGRMLRGGRDARVYYFDGKFHSEKQGIPTLIDTWKNIFIDNKNSELYQALYGPFINSLERIK